MNNIQLPVDFSSVIQVCKSEKVKTMATDLFSLRKNLIGLRGKDLFKLDDQCRNFRKREKEMSVRRCRSAAQPPHKIMPAAIPPQVCPSSQVLPQALGQLMARHGSQSPQAFP